MTPEVVREVVEPWLEAVAERIGWMPVAFVTAEPRSAVVDCGCSPEDIELATRLVSEGRGQDETILVGVDRWARSFPVTNGDQIFGVLVVLGRVTQSAAGALVRFVEMLSSLLAREERAALEHEQHRELEKNQAAVDSRLGALEADRHFHDELHELIATGTWAGEAESAGSLRHIVSCLAKHFDAPVVLQGRNLLTLAESGPGADEIALLPGRHQTARDVVAPLTRARGIVDLPAAGGLPPRLVAPIWGGGELLGFLTTAPGDVDEGSVQRALQCTVGLVALERMIRAEIEQAEQLDREALLRDLATGNSLHRLLHRGLRLDIDLRRAFVPLAFAPLPVSPSAAAQLRSVVLDVIRDTSPASTESLCAALDDIVVALVPEEAGDFIQAICERVVIRAREQSLCVKAGIGPFCRELSDYEGATGKARWVTEVLEAVGGQDWATFDDLGIYAILFDRERASQLDEFVDRQLGPLLNYDELHKTDLVETLRCVLDTGGVMTEAAKQLYIHISTLKYRVNRIEELLDTELRNPQAAFNLHLACKILAVRRHLSARTAAEPPAAIDVPPELAITGRRGPVLAPVQDAPALFEAPERPARGARR